MKKCYEIYFKGNHIGRVFAERYSLFNDEVNEIIKISF